MSNNNYENLSKQELIGLINKYKPRYECYMRSQNKYYTTDHGKNTHSKGSMRFYARKQLHKYKNKIGISEELRNKKINYYENMLERNKYEKPTNT